MKETTIMEFKDNNGNEFILKHGDYFFNGIDYKLIINGEIKNLVNIDASWVILCLSDYRHGEGTLKDVKETITNCWGSNDILKALNE